MPNSSKKHNYESFAGCGIDVGVNRADDLDKALLEEVEKNPDWKVLDIGAGAGGQAKRLAQAGAQVTAIDLYDFSQEYSDSEVDFIKGDIRNLSQLIDSKQFDFVSMQRTLHYLRYEEALKLLREIKQLNPKGFFLSVTGLNSEIGNNYPNGKEGIEERFGKLVDFAQELFSIAEPVCLYEKEEFESLLNKAGFKVEKCWESAFGNIKAICR